MGGDCVIQKFSVLQIAGSRACARKKKFPQKAEIMRMGVTSIPACRKTCAEKTSWFRDLKPPPRKYIKL